MRFDPAIEAQVSFKLTLESGQLGDDLEAVHEAEATFSATAGSEAKAAYQTLQTIGERHLDLLSFQEFLIYITWQQVTEETLPVYFKKGLDLCDQYLRRSGKTARDHGQTQAKQIRELRTSFSRGLGLADEDETEEEYDRDSFKGGD